MVLIVVQYGKNHFTTTSSETRQNIFKYVNTSTQIRRNGRMIVNSDSTVFIKCRGEVNAYYVSKQQKNVL
jgi:hypothetical protein